MQRHALCFVLLAPAGLIAQERADYMVKFGKQLAINIVPEWRGAYVDYEALKRLGQGLGVIDNKHSVSGSLSPRRSASPARLASPFPVHLRVAHHHAARFSMRAASRSTASLGTRFVEP